MRLARSDDGHVLAGICAGIAERLRLDVTLVRLTVLLLTFAWGLGALLYLAAWLLLPPAGRHPAVPLREVARGNARIAMARMRGAGRSVADAWARGTSPRTALAAKRTKIAIGLITAGGLAFLWSLGAFAWLTPTRILGLSAVAAGGAIVLNERGRRR